jgi:tRNA pseudouridine38-40 synthase
LTRTLERVLRQPVSLTCAGRTDAGVHAWGQVVSFDVADGQDLAGVQRRVNALCGAAIVVRSIEATDPGFDARHSALWRQYRYTIVNRPVPSPFLASTAWHLHTPLDLTAMRLGCDPFIGEHDFASFCRRPKHGEDDPPPSLVRRVLDASWSADGDILTFEITATAFCQQMVRSIVGFLADVGLGRRRAGEAAAVLRARSRAAASPVAPPHGLCLWEVGYP